MMDEIRDIDITVSGNEFFNVRLWQFLLKELENTKEGLLVQVRELMYILGEDVVGGSVVRIRYCPIIPAVFYTVWDERGVVVSGKTSKEFIVSPKVLNKVRIGSVILDCEKQTFMKLDAEPNLGQ